MVIVQEIPFFTPSPARLASESVAGRQTLPLEGGGQGGGGNLIKGERRF